MQKSACTYRPAERGQVGRADDVAARDRAVPRRVRPHEHRRHVRRRRQRLRRDPHVPLERVPAVERPGARAARREVDLLPRALADVGEREVAGGAVEREAPGVAEAEGPDLRPRASDADERVAGRDRVGDAAPRIDAEQLAEQAAEVLRVLGRIVAAAAVPGARVQEPVGAELQLAAPVVRRGDAGCAGRAAGWPGRRDPDRPSAGTPRSRCAGRRCSRRCRTGPRSRSPVRTRSRAGLPRRPRRCRKLQERLRLHDAVPQDEDAARLLDDVEASRVAGAAAMCTGCDAVAIGTSCGAARAGAAMRPAAATSAATASVRTPPEA